MLNRGEIPISLAFPTASVARDFVGRNWLAEALLMRYCPGPITIVVSPTARARELPPEWFASSTGAHDRTIGVRVPDSIVERQIAGATAFPITTTPVLNPDGSVITDFNDAMRSIATGIDRLPKKNRPDWIAVEGGGFHDKRSTVVRVNSNRTVSCQRRGEIPYEEITAYVDSLPPSDGDTDEYA